MSVSTSVSAVRGARSAAAASAARVWASTSAGGVAARRTGSAWYSAATATVVPGLRAARARVTGPGVPPCVARVYVAGAGGARDVTVTLRASAARLQRAAPVCVAGASVCAVWCRWKRRAMSAGAMPQPSSRTSTESVCALTATNTCVAPASRAVKRHTQV